MGIGNSSVQYHKSLPVKASALANARQNPRLQGNSGMNGRIPFFFFQKLWIRKNSVSNWQYIRSWNI
jgi:hypothetical protein